MKKIIVITRDGAYKDTAAYQVYADSPFKEGKCIQKYIKAVYRRVCTYVPDSNNSQEKEEHMHVWNSLNKKDIIIKYTDRILRKTDCPKDRLNDYYTWLFETNISPQLDNVLQNINKKPYANFQHNGFDVYFVFLNRIFDTFVNGSDQYGALVNDANRLGFIKAICQDCELIDEEGNLKGEKAILYIHDKEWYVSGAPYTAMQKGEYTKMAKSSNEKQEELKKFFDTIKVFLHIPSPFFDEITSLNFTEKDEELEILERKFW